jgi:hypothetical protein
VSEATALAELLGLTGVEVDAVEREGDGPWTVHVRTASGQRACCPGCGRAAGRVKEPTAHNVKHLALVPMQVTWHKSRFHCDSATGSHPPRPPGTSGSTLLKVGGLGDSPDATRRTSSGSFGA